MNLRQVARKIAATIACVASLGVALSVAPASRADAHHNVQYIYCWSSCSGIVRFTTYDYRQNGWGDVDWPLGFVFKQNASVNKVKTGICSLTSNAWKYCASGGPQYHYVEQRPGPVFSYTGFDEDSGRKRFEQDCGNPNWTAHMRIYAPPQNIGATTDAFYDPTDGFMAVATSHLDFKDKGGCSGRSHGLSEIAENWMIGTMTSTPGWVVSYNTQNYLNPNINHPALDRYIDGYWVPHTYDNDGYGTLVTLPW